MLNQGKRRNLTKDKLKPKQTQLCIKNSDQANQTNSSLGHTDTSVPLDVMAVLTAVLGAYWYPLCSVLESCAAKSVG